MTKLQCPKTGTRCGDWFRSAVNVDITAQNVFFIVMACIDGYDDVTRFLDVRLRSVSVEAQHDGGIRGWLGGRIIIYYAHDSPYALSTTHKNDIRIAVLEHDGKLNKIHDFSKYGVCGIYLAFTQKLRFILPKGACYMPLYDMVVYVQDA